LHINTGLTAGLTTTDSVVHLIPYTGFPRARDPLYVVT
jgi:hypothetical protein